MPLMRAIIFISSRHNSSNFQIYLTLKFFMATCHSFLVAHVDHFSVLENIRQLLLLNFHLLLCTKHPFNFLFLLNFNYFSFFRLLLLLSLHSHSLVIFCNKVRSMCRVLSALALIPLFVDLNMGKLVNELLEIVVGLTHYKFLVINLILF